VPLPRNGLCYNTLPFATYTWIETVPRIKSAIKRVDIAERNRRRNRMWKSYIRSARTRVEDACKAGKPDEAVGALNVAYAKIDRAVSKGILHRNTAARRKSRLAALIAKVAPSDPTKAAKKTRAKKSA
jgi:small subunit ribosomal protein S20